MSVGTAASRATGFVRTSLLAAVLGVTASADAYNTANTVPTMLLVLVTGGTLSAALVPLLTRPVGDAARAKTASVTASAIVVVTVATTCVAVIAAPLITRLFAARVDGADREAFLSVTTWWLVLALPQVALYALSVVSVAALNSVGRLALAGAAPVATNVVAIAVLVGYLVSDMSRPLALADLDWPALLPIGLAMTCGVAATAWLQWRGARRALLGLRLTLRLRWNDPTLRELRQVGRWTMLYVVANQVALAVIVTVANGVGGATAAYQWAFAVMQLPYAVIAVSLLSSAYPRLVRAHDDLPLLARRVARTTRLVLFLMLPCGVLLLLLAAPLAALLTGYAGGTGVPLVTAAVQLFGLALVPFTAFQLLTRVLYAVGDPKVPALVNVAVAAVNIAGALATAAIASSDEAVVRGLVAAYAASYAVGALLLGVIIRSRVPTAFAGVLRTLVRATLALAPAAGLVAVIGVSDKTTASPGQAVSTLALGALAAACYGLVAARLRMRELRQIKDEVTRRSAR